MGSPILRSLRRIVLKMHGGSAAHVELHALETNRDNIVFFSWFLFIVHFGFFFCILKFFHEFKKTFMNFNIFVS